MKYRKLVKQLNNLQLFRIFMERRNKTVRIKTKKKAFVSVLLSFVMIMGLFFVPKVNAEEQPDQPNTISFKQVQNEMDTVNVILSIDGEESNISYPAGLITDNLTSLGIYLNETQKFQKAVVKDSSTNTETPISRIGTYEGTTYYSLNDQQDIGIALTVDQKIVLICASEYNVTYDYEEELGTVTGPDTISNGEDLNISIQANDTYHISSVLFNDTAEPITENQKTASLKIESSRITDNITIKVDFAVDTSYTIIEFGAEVIDGEYKIPSGNRDGIQHGDLCGSDTEKLITPINPGDNATFWLYSQSNSGGDYWDLNMLKINGEDINVIYNAGEEDVGTSVETTLSNNSVVTLKLIGIRKSISWKNDNKPRTIYQVTVTNVRENLIFEGNFKEINNREIIITGLDGINDVGASEVHEYRGNFYYELQSNDSDRVYSVSYDKNWSADKALNIYFFSVAKGYNPYTINLEVSHNGIKKELNDVLNNEFLNNGYWMTIDEFKQKVNPNNNNRYFDFYYKERPLLGITEYNPTPGILGYYDEDYSFFYDLENNYDYTHVFVLNKDDSSEAVNQIAKLTAKPYQYNLVFNLNGGNATFNGNYQSDDNQSYIEIKADGSTKTYTIANGAVDAYMPTVKPTKDGSVFLGWKLYKGDTPVSETLYDPNEAFTIDETSINYSEGDVTSDIGHTFTFVAQWEDVATSADTAALFVETYKEVPNSQDGAIEYNGRYYVLDSEILNDYGTVGNPSILIRYTNPDSNTYSLNSEQSKFYIENVLNENDSDAWKENNTFKVYYDFIDYDLTVKKDAVGEYADLTREWNIRVTLKDQNGTPISNTSFREDVTTDDKGQVILKLHDNENFKFENLNINTQFSIQELNTSEDYVVTYQIGENNPTGGPINDVSLTSDTTVTVINTMKDINIPDTNIPTSGMNNTITMLGIGSIGIVGIVTLLWYWRKKHV
ncbi:hypothetical protein KEC48_16070 [Clostridium sp. C1]|uniref:DUF7601 domain-containing protein n=1 Tax=Clostridium sp. C1 TaxID=1155388 RepID=UPI001BAB6647|nr:hypothetical protein [Clostridium sp. C1]QUN12956.1 hypothetical protein KEC48_16070 [Clostridium sp. C1]